MHAFSSCVDYFYIFIRKFTAIASIILQIICIKVTCPQQEPKDLVNQQRKYSRDYICPMLRRAVKYLLNLMLLSTQSGLSGAEPVFMIIQLPPAF